VAENASTSATRDDRRSAMRTGLRTMLISLLVGAVTSAATWLFLVTEHAVINVLWHQRPEVAPGVPAWAVSVAVVIVMTGLAALVVRLSGGRPFDMGHAEAEYDQTGRMEYRKLVGGIAFSLLSLFSGAAVGPEAPLTDINGGLGTLIAERLKLSRDQVRTMTYAGVAGAFSAFFGAAPVGALLAAELINQKAITLSRTTMVAGLASGATAWIVFLTLGGGSLPPVLAFSAYATPHLVDEFYAIGIGLVGGVLGLAYGGALRKTRLLTLGLRDHPWLAAVAGGVPTAIVAVTAPVLLFSGQTEVPTLIADAAIWGIVALLVLGVAKLVLSGWSLSTGYFGGPLFPVIFAGTCFGLALNLAVPTIPQGVAVMAVIAGMTVAATAAPLSVTIFLALIAEPSLTSIIAVAAVAAYIIRQVVAPTIPGIYGATAQQEAAAAAGYAQ
jgi:H+/Cl- antiporter ClcA